MEQTIDAILETMQKEEQADIYQYAQKLIHSEQEGVGVKMLSLLHHEVEEYRFLACQVLQNRKDKGKYLDAIFDILESKEYPYAKGQLVGMLEAFDTSAHFVKLFKLYLYGDFRTQTMAKDLLDYGSFAITPRVLKKVEKNWNHYSNNVKKDEVYALTAQEVSKMIKDMKQFLEGQ